MPDRVESPGRASQSWWARTSTPTAPAMIRSTRATTCWHSKFRPLPIASTHAETTSPREVQNCSRWCRGSHEIGLLYRNGNTTRDHTALLVHGWYQSEHRGQVFICVVALMRERAMRLESAFAVPALQRLGNHPYAFGKCTSGVHVFMYSTNVLTSQPPGLSPMYFSRRMRLPLPGACSGWRCPARWARPGADSSISAWQPLE